MKANQNKKGGQQKQKQKQGGDDGSGGGGGGAAAAAAGGDGGACDDQDSEAGVDRTYERFYHLYREGELEEDMRAAGGRVLESGYERDNWWVIGGHAETP
ncbi:hypothetical protein ONZ43_g7003 [Nemania bipapillata]|uniref:Uncharacterized protein n=1 Tax=Nemania bipapillata TaxID=110536 RepID=A0ACC2HVS0_9PEZI|nr:hypothetical protein ONZ43_g7003 [Nemania bipapillata]